MNTETLVEAPPKKRFSGLQVLGLVLLAIVITVLITAFVIKKYLWPSEFRPVELNQKEEQVLQGKLEAIGLDADVVMVGDQPLVAEPYSEAGASRDVYFGERELNALVARNTSMANRLAIDLSDDLASAKMLIPVPEDFPIMSGQTVRVTAGVEMAFENNRPIVILKGVSLMGVPIPNAWLGNLKNVDLVQQFGGNDGFWKTFSDGVELIEVTDGRLHVKLRE
ncbi:MAG: arginine N-succinyltransferase [Gammaproteobacteria bacterium]|nr:arginine N-succinyltransferase [Gammaproteobacteria bacterium]NND59857.1 arginine N-succinyltransferase [Gammaproteobacteria bacterium]